MNLNSFTLVHRDVGDESICVVVVASNCKGGALILVEPGLVLPLKHGDTVIFPSAKISHLNAHFVGIRASLVFHSDSSCKSWIVDRNGWQNNFYFR